MGKMEKHSVACKGVDISVIELDCYNKMSGGQNLERPNLFRTVDISEFWKFKYYNNESRVIRFFFFSNLFFTLTFVLHWKKIVESKKLAVAVGQLYMLSIENYT